jgi:hypothetical protein
MQLDYNLKFPLYICKIIRLRILNDTECFPCVDAIFTTHAPLADVKRIIFPAAIRKEKKKLVQISYILVRLNVTSL